MDDRFAVVGGRAARSALGALPLEPALDVLQVELHAEEALVCEPGCCSVSGVPHLQVYAVALARAEYVRRRMPPVYHYSKQAWMIGRGFFLCHRAQHTRVQSYRSKQKMLSRFVIVPVLLSTQQRQSDCAIGSKFVDRAAAGVCLE